jgi:hypothetical protein
VDADGDLDAFIDSIFGATLSRIQVKTGTRFVAVN